MIKGDYDKLQGIAGRNLCAEHKTPLVVAWHSGEKRWTIRCGEGHYPDAVTRQLSLTELDKAGQLPSGPIQENIRKRQRRKAMTQEKKPGDFLTALVPHVDLATGEVLGEGLIKGLVAYAKEYGLDPYRSHVVLMYGKPYITIDGYLYHAQRTEKAYSLSSRPLTEQERAQYLIGAEDHAWVAELQFTDTGSTFTGLGVVTQEEMTAKSKRDITKVSSPVVAAHPWQLAQKRSEWQALRRAFPIGEIERKTEV